MFWKYQKQIFLALLNISLSRSIPLLRLPICKDNKGDALNDEDGDGDDPDNPPVRNVTIISLDNLTGNTRSNKARDRPNTVGQAKNCSYNERLSIWYMKDKYLQS